MMRSDMNKQMSGKMKDKMMKKKSYAKGGMTSCGSKKKKYAAGGSVKSKGCGMARSRPTKIR